jgi:hypothetical protein
VAAEPPRTDTVGAQVTSTISKGHQELVLPFVAPGGEAKKKPAAKPKAKVLMSFSISLRQFRSWRRASLNLTKLYVISWTRWIQTLMRTSCTKGSDQPRYLQILDDGARPV